VGAVLLAAAVAAAGGCKAEEAPKLDPKVKPPAVSKAGVLKAGVDLKTPPFGGSEKGQKVGLDVDVAAALAEKLGLTVEYVDVSPSDAATALAEGKVDIVLSVPPSAASLSSMSLAGSYVSDAPALFVATEGTASVEPSLTLDSALPAKIAVQEGSEAFWILTDEFGADAVTTYPTLREAFDALTAGDVTMVAGDALVGAYMARDMANLRMAGQLAPATPLAVAVTAENTTLGEAVRLALDELAAGGVFETLRSKWVGDAPALVGLEAQE
jgi:polar amino acid transport system substrate-binding protein